MTVKQQGQRAHMRRGKVADMDIVAHRRTVGRRIVAAQNVQRRAAIDGGIDSARDQVGFRVMIFADLAPRIRAGSVEIAQRCDTQP